MINKDKFYSNYEIFDKEIVREIIDIYIQEYPERIENITKNIDDKDLDMLLKNAHSMKGVTANFFDHETEEYARQLEIKAKDKDPLELDIIFEKLVFSSLQLVEDLKILRKEYE